MLAACAGTEPERSARLPGAADALREELGGRFTGLELTQHERALAQLGPGWEEAFGGAAAFRWTTRSS